MVQNIWNKTQIVCACHGEEYPKMEPRVGSKSVFYACPKYYPENRDPGDRIACMNNIDDVIMEKILEKISEEISEQMQDGQTPFIKNVKFKIRDVECKVVAQDDNGITVAVKNRRALAK